MIVLRTALAIAFAAGAATFFGTPAAPAASGLSYTAAQAAAGAKAFSANCAACHGANLQGISAPALKGKASGISQQSVGELYEYISQQMPLTNPGGLSSDQYVAIVAYLLKANGRQPGDGKLDLTTAKSATVMVRP